MIERIELRVAFAYFVFKFRLFVGSIAFGCGSPPL